MTAKELEGKQKFSNPTVVAKRWLSILFALLVLMGIFFRVANLDKKPVWADETHTFSVISGYSEQEATDKLPDTTPTSVETFLKYRYPNIDKNLGDSLHELYTDVHPPLYFLTARTFVEWFGASVSVLRSASAFLSLLTLPCMYWLCLELFRSHFISGVATALFCVSPFQVLYSQEARPYSLFTLVILLSGASLLWAMRTKKLSAWAAYAASVALGFYTQFFFLFVLLGYLFYVFSVESFRLTKRFRSFLLASFIGFIAFSPWLITVLIHLSNFKEKSSWISEHKLSLPGAIRLWSENISLSFVDPRTSEYLGFGRFGLYFLIPLILGLVLYSLYFLIIKTPKSVYLFVLTLILSTALPLIAADLILGGNRQVWPRYLVPCFIGVQLSVSHLLGTKVEFTDPTQKDKNRKFWLLITTALITAGVIFSAIITQAETWWNKYEGGVIIAVSDLVNKAEAPIVISSRSRPSSVFYYRFDPDVKILSIPDEKLASYSLPKDANIFLLNPSDALELKVSQAFELEQLAQFAAPGPLGGKPTTLWKVKSHPKISAN